MDIRVAELVRRLRELSGRSQASLARAAGTSQPTIAAYESGCKVPGFATLERLAAAAGFDLSIGLVPALTREDQRSLLLHSRIAQRLRDDPEGVLRLARANLRRMRQLHPHVKGSLDRWASILGRGVEDIAAVLIDPSPEFRELRAVTPFAGVLTAAERAEVYQTFRQQRG